MPPSPLELSKRVADLDALVTQHEGTIKDLSLKVGQATQMIEDIHSGLMKPQPGYEDSLLDRVAKVTLSVETGNAFGNRLIWLAKVLGALSIIASAVYALSHLGDPPKGV